MDSGYHMENGACSHVLFRKHRRWTPQDYKIDLMLAGEIHYRLASFSHSYDVLDGNGM